MFSLFSYGLFFVLGFCASQYDFNVVYSRIEDIKSLYNSTFEKEKSHTKTTYKLAVFISSMYFEKLKRYINHHIYNHIMLNNNKILCTVQINNKTRYFPICSTQTQIPDIMEIKFEKDENNTNEKLNEIITSNWLQTNLTSIVSIQKHNNSITPVDLGLKSLSITVLNDDIETFTFSQNDEIKLYKN